MKLWVSFVSLFVARGLLRLRGMGRCDEVRAPDREATGRLQIAMPVDPVKNLLVIVEACERGDLPPDDVVDWLSEGVWGWYDTPSVTLEESLGLNGGRGVSDARGRVKQLRRNRYFAKAWAALAQEKGRRPTAREFWFRVMRYKHQRWPREHNLKAPLYRGGMVDVYLFHAFKVGLPVPKSKRGLLEAIRPLIQPDGAGHRVEPKTTF